MGKLGPILCLGFGILVGGIYYHLWTDSITFIEDYIVKDQFYNLIRFIWDAIPVIIFIVGIIWLIREGTQGSSGRRVVYE